MKNGRSTASRGFNCLLSSSPPWQLALATLQRLGGRKLEASAVSFNAAMAACGRQQAWEHMLQLLSDMPKPEPRQAMLDGNDM